MMGGVTDATDPAEPADNAEVRVETTDPPEEAAPAAPAELPDEGRVKQALVQQRLELEAAKYLRNLRRDAFIDVRG